MKAPKIDQASRQDIDKLVGRLLRDAGFREPPVDIGRVMDTLKLDREFYDLESPRLLRRLRHRLLVGTRRFSEFVGKVSLQALILFDDKRILLDRKLPTPKHDWAFAHEAGHELIPWHRSFSRGDTLNTLDPAWHEQLEAEANYAASGLLFCGEVFTADARDSAPSWAAVEKLKQHYKKSWVTTVRRYVEYGPDLPMVLLVSTAPWDQKPPQQATRVRHLVLSPSYESTFMDPDPELLRNEIDAFAQKRRGGLVGEFECRLRDRDRDVHVFHAESFYNTHYLITLFVGQGPAAASVNIPTGAATA